MPFNGDGDDRNCTWAVGVNTGILELPVLSFTVLGDRPTFDKAEVMLACSALRTSKAAEGLEKRGMHEAADAVGVFGEDCIRLLAA